MALYDKVISILSIPAQNTNDSNANSTNLYEEWADGDGQYLLPLLLILTVVFCCFCAAIQLTIFVAFLCVRKVLGDDVEWDDAKENKGGSRREESQKSSNSEKQQEEGTLMGSQAESTNGTPRSRKSIVSSPIEST